MWASILADYNITLYYQEVTGKKKLLVTSWYYHEAHTVMRGLQALIKRKSRICVCEWVCCMRVCVCVHARVGDDVFV